MTGYNFDEGKEYSNYKAVGSKESKPNYCEWEDSILKEHEYITEKKYFINFKAFLKDNCKTAELRHEIISSLLIPLFVLLITFTIAIPSIFAGLRQYQDSLQGNIDSEYLDNMKKSGSEQNEIIKEQVKTLQSRVNEIGKTIKFIMLLLYVVYFIILAGGGGLVIISSRILKKVYFYKDYIAVLDKAIENLEK